MPNIRHVENKSKHIDWNIQQTKKIKEVKKKSNDFLG